MRVVDALQTSEAKYRILTESMTDVVWTLDPETLRFLYVSPSVEKLRGYTPEEILAEPLDAAVPPVERPRVRALLAERIAAFEAGGGSEPVFFTDEVLQACKDGTSVWTEVVTRYYRDPDSGRVAIAGLTRDITKRKAAESARVESDELFHAASEQALQESERLVQSILNTTPNLIYIYDIAENRNVYSNREVTGFLGYTPEQIEAFGSELFAKILHPDDAAHVAEHHTRLAAADDGEVFRVDYRMQRASGEWRWLHSRDVPFARGADGAVTQILGFTEDITQQRQADFDLRESNARLEKMVHDVTEVIGKVVEARDPYTLGHERRVAALGRSIALEMGLPGSDAEAVEMAALVHDVGKLSIPTEILTKPGLLSETEFALIREHSQYGYEILKRVDFGHPVADIVLQHHERMDGSGYPRGLSGDGISMAARILAVADVVEAMSSHRPYRPALGIEAALRELRRNQQKFDPSAVAACVRLHESGQLDFGPEGDVG